MMKKILSKYWKIALIVAFALSVVAFWSIGYSSALAYQEQFQMFLLDGAYFYGRIMLPGGLAAYMSEFLTQFYLLPVVGGCIIAVELVLIQAVVWLLAHRNINNSVDCSLVFLLSFVPSLMLWHVMGDESVMPAFGMSLLIALASMIPAPRRLKQLLAYALLVIPVAYWAAGPVAVLPTVYVSVRAYRSNVGKMKALAVMGLALLYLIFIILLSHYLVPYSSKQLLSGLFYYRFPNILPYSFILIMVVCILLVTVPLTIPSALNKFKRWLVPALVIVLVGMAVLTIPMGYDKKSYELIDYDYLVRTKQWNRIIAKAEKQMPDLPMSVCATNLALGMTGQLGDRCFDFFQNGTEGLLPEFERNFSTTLLTGDVYFLLGLVNTSQRYAFEAMEAIPNYNKSARAIKRLAETNLVNGQYKVARKYLTMLQKTIFYRNWAEKRLEMIDNPRLIDEDNVYGYLRKVRLTDDFLFSDKELDKMFGQLLMRNKDNMMAMQYLLVYPLLNRDIPHFMAFLNYVQTLKKYSPRACVEAAAFACAQQGKLPPAEMQRFQYSSTWKYLMGEWKMGD
ncbi:MAG: DUF6057 family protein [Prevotella sp.]